MSNQIFDRIPELQRIDERDFVNQCTSVLQSPNAVRDLKGYAQSKGIADFTAREIVPATRQEAADLLGLNHEPRIRVEIRLQTRPEQQMVKNIRIAFCPFGRREAHALELNIPVQLLGYGPYSLAFYKPGQGGVHNFDGFFSELARNHVNFHRAILFSDEGYEGNRNPVRLLLKKGTDPKNAEVNPAFLSNLNDLVRTAKKYNIVVQVGLFSHHSVADGNKLKPPMPITQASLGNSPMNRYRNFYHLSSPWKPLQERMIKAVTQTLMNHWNVVYEVGNEMRLPARKPGDQAYTDNDLRNWVTWAADYIHRCSYGKLVTCSTGIQNEAIINRIPRISFASFHGGQWDPQDDNRNLVAEMTAALRRSEGYGPGHHLVIDDDGHYNGRGDGDQVSEWAFIALNVGGKGQCSFNHKGPYMPWAAGDPFADGRDELKGLADAWNGTFEMSRFGFPVKRPKPELHVQP